MRRTLLADEGRKAGYNWIDFCTILTTLAYLQKAAGFMQKTRLLKKFQGLKWGGTTWEKLYNEQKLNK